MKTKKLLIIVATLLSYGIIYSADDNETSVNDEDSQVNVKVLNYDYVLDPSACRQCEGDIELEISFPPNAKRLIFMRTRGFYTEEPNLIFYISKGTIDFEPGSTAVRDTRTHMRWGCYFQVKCDLEDSTYIVSPRYFSSDYILKEDLDKILSPTTSITEFDKDTDDSDFRLTGKYLEFDRDCIKEISIFNSVANKIYHCDDLQEDFVDLTEFGQQFLVIQGIDNNNKILTIKTILR